MRQTLLSLTAALLCPLAATAAPLITTLPQPELDWTTTPEGVAFAPIEGDRFEGAYMAMVRLPAGLVSPTHTKTSNMFGLVLEGTMTHVPDGSTAKAVALEKGAFYKIPKDLAHVSSCISDAPCVTFLYQDGKFDFLPVVQQ